MAVHGYLLVLLSSGTRAQSGFEQWIECDEIVTRDRIRNSHVLGMIGQNIHLAVGMLECNSECTHRILRVYPP